MSGPTPDSPKARMPIESKAQLIESSPRVRSPGTNGGSAPSTRSFPSSPTRWNPCPMRGRAPSGRCSKASASASAGGRLEGENIIALSDPNGLGNVSLEPGGQFELSGGIVETVHDTCEEVHEHLSQVREVGDRLGIGFLGLGASPIWSRAETPVMPKGRYGIMAPYMDKVGRYGRDMMFRTCTVQVNLDFASRSGHGEEAPRVAGAAARSPRHSSPIRPSSTASPTAFCPSAPRSGATPTTSAPACCPSPSRTAWASSAMSTMRSTCRCIS